MVIQNELSWYLLQVPEISAQARLLAIWLYSIGGEVHRTNLSYIGRVVPSIEMFEEELISKGWIHKTELDILHLHRPYEIVASVLQSLKQDTPKLLSPSGPSIEEMAKQWIIEMDGPPVRTLVNIDLSTKTVGGRAQRSMWLSTKTKMESGKISWPRMVAFVQAIRPETDQLSGLQVFSMKPGSWFLRYVSWEEARNKVSVQLHEVLDHWYLTHIDEFKWGPNGMAKLIPLLENALRQEGKESVIDRINSSPGDSTPWQVFGEQKAQSQRLPSQRKTAPTLKQPKDSTFLTGFEK